MMAWKPLLARTAAISAIVSAFVSGAVFVGIRLADADPGGPTTPNGLTFAGVLRERIGAGATTLTFVFRKGATTVCTASTRSFSVDENGAFSVDVPLDACADGGMLFDGATIVYDVRLGGATGDLLTPTDGVSITAVPYARFADQTGVNNDCPSGYSRDTSDPAITPTMRLCVRAVTTGGRDEVVRVGSGASAFWIDRYEASVFNAAGSHFGATDDTYPNLLKNGQWATPTQRSPPLLAQSRRGVPPSRYITWFQASEACRASGKRLPTGNEWFAASQGTIDPSDASDGRGGDCLTLSATGPRSTGRMSGGMSVWGQCISVWGAEDMIGNVSEYTGDWHAGLGTVDGLAPTDPPGTTGWPLDGNLYRGDGTHNIDSSAYPGGGGRRTGIPAVEVRGGGWISRTRAGVFALELGNAPSHWDQETGFRCVVPR